MAAAGAAAGAAAAAYVEQVACFESFCDAIRLLITNRAFDAESFRKRRLFLSESYCLLWHNAGTGNIDGRKSSIQLRTGALAAVLLDLYALGRIDIHLDTSKLQSPDPHHQSLVLCVKDAKFTDSYLDKAILDKILTKHTKDPDRQYPIVQWVEKAEQSCCVALALANLVKRGILDDVHSGFFGIFHKYPTKDFLPEQELEAEMKEIALREKKPDSYMLALLTLSRTADNFFSFVDPIIEKHFTKDEYKVAKENIKVIVQSQGTILRSPKLDRKKMASPKPERKLFGISPKPERKLFGTSPKPERKSFTESPKPGKKFFSISPKPERKQYAVSPRQERRSFNGSPMPERKLLSTSPKADRYLTVNAQDGRRSPSGTI